MVYRMTAARRAALRKAQAASARKRRGRGRKKRSTRRQLVNMGLGFAAVGGAVALYGANRRVGGKIQRFDFNTLPSRIYQPMNSRFIFGTTKKGEPFAGVRVRGNYSQVKYSTRNTRRNPFMV